MKPPIPTRLRRRLFLAVVLFLTFGGAAVGQDLGAGDSITVKGVIKQVTPYEPPGKLVGEILVEVESKGKYSFLLRKTTQILQGNAEPGNWTDLMIERRVSVTYNGIVSPGRPPQAGADRVVIEIPPKSDAPR